MAKVIYTPEVFCDIDEGTYFDFKGSLYLLIDRGRELVFDFEEGHSFYWNDEWELDTPIRIISSDRVTIKVD